MNLSDKSKYKTPDRYAENAQGDFYVEDGVCTACGAPEVAAPDLIEHSTGYYGHCYFKKQPQTEEEIERAINALAVSCISGLRYGGTDEKILKRLYEMGEGNQCDHKPIGNYKTLIWDKGMFQFDGSMQELSVLITTQIIALEPAHLNKQIINLKLKDSKYFEFIYRWVDGLTGNIFKCYFMGENIYRVEISTEINGHEISLPGSSILLNAILRQDMRVSKIVWFDKDNNTYNETEVR